MSALSGSGASRAAHACIPEDKHVFCRSLLDLHHKHEWHALVMFVDLSNFYCDGRINVMVLVMKESVVMSKWGGTQTVVDNPLVNYVLGGSGVQEEVV